MATARIDVDHPSVARWASRGLAVLALTAFAVGAPALVEVGNWAGLGWSAWGLPLVVDLGLVIGAVSATVARQRQSRAGLLWFGTIVLVMLSTVAQGVHAWTRADVDGPARWVAIALGALPPLAVLWSTEALIRLIVSEPVSHQARKKQPQVATEVDQSAQPGPRSTGPVVVRGPARGQDRTVMPHRPATRETSGPMDRAAIVARARSLMKDGGASQRAVAAELGVARATLKRWLDEANLADVAPAKDPAEASAA